MPKGDIGIDLGTASIIVYKRGEGIVLHEPSVVAISEKTGEIVAIGEEAKKMLGKTPEGLKAIRPMKDGVIADYKTIEAIIRSFLRRIVGRFSFMKPSLIIGVPTKITEVEKRAVFEAGLNAGARRVHIVSEPIAAAIGAGIDVMASEGNMVVDIGGGTTDIAVISLGGTVVGESVRMAGDAMDEAIVKFVRKKYGLVIGESTAEEIKKRIGKTHPAFENYEVEIKGRDVVTGLPRTDRVNSEDVREAIEPIIMALLTKIKNVLERTPPELSADIINNGIHLTGGGALLRGLDRTIYDEIHVKTIVAEDPITCVARGTGILLEDERLLKTVCETFAR
ncbi:rod shape-determining protein MreB [Thermotoga sp. RQ7]|uniref:rod shape-determining protein n=1 Tax=Thermotoga sp. RQ7 TaxID=126738 RepID=UPI0005A320D0|nr:rod shape-determining protein [Thermotoga sp. RQ7]AJG41218.1 rod shape-determining protein MreB [Thermotoga sp. RQ7]MDK2785813.1 rod shape-determining protein MreB [Thermotoga sp.]